MLDLVIRGGTVVAPVGVGDWDVAIEGERIVALAAPGTLTQDVGRVIDASGKLVVPGGIDPHVHCKWPIPHPPGLSADPSQVSRAAIYGGTTTLIDFAAWVPGETLQQTIENREPDWKGNCYADYAYHVMLRGVLPWEIFDQIPETIAAGFPSFKIFMTNIWPHVTGRMVKLGHIWEVLQRTSRHGGIVAIHAEDDDIVMHMYDKLHREGRTGTEFMPEAHNSMSEDISFRRIIRLAEHVEGAALYMMHVSAESGVNAIAEARSRGLPIYGETLGHYTCFTAEAYRRPDGQIYHTYPSLKEEQDRLALWRGLGEGPLSTVATDEVCTSHAVKVKGKSIDDTTGGHVGVETRLGVMYTESVVKRGMSLPHFVGLSSANAAKLLGLYPKKGAIAPGSDADIAIMATGLNTTIKSENLHESDYSAWDGWEIDGWPVMTILRGKIVMEDGKLLGEPTDGKRALRKVADSIQSRPAV